MLPNRSSMNWDLLWFLLLKDEMQFGIFHTISSEKKVNGTLSEQNCTEAS